MIEQWFELPAPRMIGQPVDVVYDLLGDPVSDMRSGFRSVVVPDGVELLGRVFSYLYRHFFLRAASRVRTCCVVSTRPWARSSSAFSAREVSLAFSNAFFEPPLRMSRSTCSKEVFFSLAISSASSVRSGAEA
jgi:hypothetical protein